MKKLSSLRTFLSILMLGVGLAAMAAKVDVLNLKTENLVNPLGIDTAEPRFSWQLQSHYCGLVGRTARQEPRRPVGLRRCFFAATAVDQLCRSAVEEWTACLVEATSSDQQGAFGVE